METPAVTQTNSRAGLIPVIVFFAVVLGVGTGFGLVKYRNASGAVGGKVKTATEVGVNDTKTFKDSAEGKLAKGGVDGEGTHHLVRVGGSSQNVYLTSSVVDLDQFVGKKVKVFGQTFAAQNAGWLMDVGKVEVLP